MLARASVREHRIDPARVGSTARTHEDGSRDMRAPLPTKDCEETGQ